jgi:hypothetical protein
MQEHCSTQGTVSNNPHQDNVAALDAIESLHTHLVKIEALALVACEAADRLEPPSSREAKRELIRMQIFAGQTASEATEAVAYGDRVMEELKERFRVRQTAPQARASSPKE